jgi:hypothetical protein
MDADSPLSISSNIIGILTFVAALIAAAYARLRYLRNCHTEYLRVKRSLLWFKTESEWLDRLLRPLAGRGHPDFKHGLETHMCQSVMEDLSVLEQRLLDLVERIESTTSATETVAEHTGGSPWALLRGQPSVAVAWLSARTEMLELVRQREALAGRVQFLQLSMVAARLGALEARLEWAQGMDEAYLRKLAA